MRHPSRPRAWRESSRPCPPTRCSRRRRRPGTRSPELARFLDVDLHLHTTASDGALSPRDVVAAAAAAALDIIAIADHDTVAGLVDAFATAAELTDEGTPVRIIPALEMSTTDDDADLHILGYFVDPDHPDLVDFTRVARQRREDRLREMVVRLADSGVDVSFDRVRAAAGERGTLARPHLAQAMVEAGHVATVSEAFDRYIANDKPAYIPTRLMTPAQAIELIGRCGGIAVWAHPPAHLIDALLPGLVRAGLRGIEVYRPGMTPSRTRRYEQVAKSAGLLVSGGSDWHGPGRAELGEFRVEGERVRGLLEEGGVEG